jgi:deoxyribonuclease-4
MWRGVDGVAGICPVSYVEPMMPPVLLGSHMSVSGGVHTAFDRGTRIGCTTMQVFVKNANQWEGKPLTWEDIESYKRAGAKSRIDPVVAHAA